MKSMQTGIVTSLIVLSLTCSAFGEFVVPEFRGNPLSTYQEWTGFASATAPNLPNSASSNPNGIATLQELTGGAFLTSGGNIYSFAVATSFEVLIPDYGLGENYSTTVVLQLRTLGATVDLDSITCNGTAFDTAELLYEEPLGGFGGILRDWKFEWSGISGNVELNTILFEAAGPSMSLARVSVDTLAAEASLPWLVDSRLVHVGFGGAGQPPFNAVDYHREFALRGEQPIAVELIHLNNSSLGINGLVLDIANLSQPEAIQLAFSMSPQGNFDPESVSIEDWPSAPLPVSIEHYPGEGLQESHRVFVRWSDQSIMNRYLRVRVSMDDSQIADLFIGHLLGKTVESTGDTFTVAFADISPIRAKVGQAVTASSLVDIDKSGTVTFADISVMRGSVGFQLTRLVVPPMN